MHTPLTPLRLLSLMFALLLTSACGYMDSDLLLEEEAFNASLDLGEEHISMGGLHISGIGSSGCGSGIMGYGGGGSYSYGYGKRYKSAVHVSEISSDAGILALGMGALANAGGLKKVKTSEEEEEVETMTPEDIFILNHTTVEAIAATGSLVAVGEAQTSREDLAQE